MVVEFTNYLQKHEGMNKYDTIVTSSSQHLRPILMTVSAMVVGVIPLVTSSGVVLSIETVLCSYFQVV